MFVCMLFDLSSDADRRDFNEYADRLKKCGARCELVEKKPNRTLRQNAYLHVILAYFASEFGYSLEEVKLDIFKRTCNRGIFAAERVNPRGEGVEYMRSTASLDSGQLTEAIERFRDYSAVKAGLYIPSPAEHAALFEAQKQIDRYANFI